MFRRQIMHTAHYVRPGHTPPARQGGQGQLYKWRELRGGSMGEMEWGIQVYMVTPGD